jgi:NADPH2:quinone reductase
MRAVAVRRFGDTPELMELPIPRPRPGEVLVEVGAASVNPMDWRMAAGEFERQLPHTFPLILGVDGAGTVVELGEGARRFRVGDPVYGQLFRAPLGTGTYAEYVAVPEHMTTGAIQVAPVGYAATYAAALPTVGMTAVGLLDTIDPQPGQTVLVVGATGGVGSTVVQLAAQCGAEVIGTARPDAAKWLRGLGASETVDHSADSVVDRVRASHPDGVHALVDVASDAESFSALAELVRDGGRAVSLVFGATSRLLDESRIAVANYTLPRPPPDDPHGTVPSPSKADLLWRFTAIVEAGGVDAPMQTEVRLADAPSALARNRSGRARGKTVIRI